MSQSDDRWSQPASDHRKIVLSLTYDAERDTIRYVNPSAFKVNWQARIERDPFDLTCHSIAALEWSSQRLDDMIGETAGDSVRSLIMFNGRKRDSKLEHFKKNLRRAERALRSCRDPSLMPLVCANVQNARREYRAYIKRWRMRCLAELEDRKEPGQ